METKTIPYREKIIGWPLKCILKHSFMYIIKSIRNHIYLRGEAILLWVSETASPTYLSPTSRPSKRPRFTSFNLSKSLNKFNGLTYLIDQSDPSTKNKTLIFTVRKSTIRKRTTWAIIFLLPKCQKNKKKF